MNDLPRTIVPATLRLVSAEPPELPVQPGALYEQRRSLPARPDRVAEFGLRTRGLYKRSLPGKPLVSVVTPVLNGASHVAQTIASVLGLTWDNVEYIVIDGGSTDGTLDILKAHSEVIDYCVSEPDAGISDSFNKGVSLASGDLIGIINADDWYEPHAAALAAGRIADIACFSYGACAYLRDDGSALIAPPDGGYGRRIAWFMPQIHHPTVFMKRQIYQRHGLFRTDLKYAMDYELLLRLYRRGLVGLALPEVMARMRTQGVSNTRYREVREETRRISIEHGASPLAAHAVYWLLLLKYALVSRNKWKGTCE